MFGPNEIRQLGGLSLERQVINILVKRAAPMAKAELQVLLEPKPSAPAFEVLLVRMCKENAIAEIPDKGIGLPGWFLGSRPAPVRRAHQLIDDEEEEGTKRAVLPEVPPAPTTPPEETTMPKTKRAARVSTEVADTTIEAVLNNNDVPLKAARIASDAKLSLAVTTKALKRLKQSGRAISEGSGTEKRGWSKATGTPRAVELPPVKVEAKSPSTAAPPKSPAAGDRKFGYFSDGSVSIACEACSGTLTVTDLKAFRAFATRFEETAK